VPTRTRVRGASSGAVADGERRGVDLRLESNETGGDGCGGELHASWCGDFARCYGWRSKRSTPVRSIDHGRAERHHP
jgi:hypothetical protein